MSAPSSVEAAQTPARSDDDTDYAGCQPDCRPVQMGSLVLARRTAARLLVDPGEQTGLVARTPIECRLSAWPGRSAGNSSGTRRPLRPATVSRARRWPAARSVAGSVGECDL